MEGYGSDGQVEMDSGRLDLTLTGARACSTSAQLDLLPLEKRKTGGSPSMGTARFGRRDDRI